MKFNPPSSVAEIAKFLGREYVGDGNQIVTGINEIHRVEPGDVVFVDNTKYFEKALNCPATIILINQKVDPPAGKALIISDQPFNDFNRITIKYRPFHPWDGDTKYSVGTNTAIHKSATIGENVTIGSNCIIHPGVVIGNECVIGNNVIIHANTVLGADAFYYKTTNGLHNKMHSCGNVVIEDDVEIGALCAIDRGVTSETRIGKGTKIDNSVQIGHDTVVGQGCRFAAHVAIAGCVTIGNNVTAWGQVGLISGITIGNNVEILGQSGVSKNVADNSTILGSPAIAAGEKWREMAAVRGLTQSKSGN